MQLRSQIGRSLKTPLHFTPRTRHVQHAREETFLRGLVLCRRANRQFSHKCTCSKPFPPGNKGNTSANPFKNPRRRFAHQERQGHFTSSGSDLGPKGRGTLGAIVLQSIGQHAFQIIFRKHEADPRHGTSQRSRNLGWFHHCSKHLASGPVLQSPVQKGPKVARVPTEPCFPDASTFPAPSSSARHAA